jgi:hypothetical protein
VHGGASVMIVRIDTRRILNWDTFHNIFAETFGFPDYYGRNMNAWIDCMTYLNDPKVSDTSLKAAPGEVVVLQLDNVDDLYERCPEIYSAIIESAAFINWRQTQVGDGPVLALSFNKTAFHK